jgi:hypothetical protein
MDLLFDENDDFGWKQIISKNESESIKKQKCSITEYSMDYIKTVNVSQSYYDAFLPKLNILLQEMGIPVINEYRVKQETWTRNQPGSSNRTHNNDDKYFNPKKQQRVVPTTGLHAMKLSLNKLTDKNYIDISLKMEIMIEEWLKIEKSQEEIEKMGELIFNIASNNRMFSKVYADLYTYLSSKNKTILDTFYPNFIKYRGLFESIDVDNTSDDYDTFCKINVTNEKRRAVSTFMVNLVKNNMLQSSELYSIVLRLLDMLKEMFKLSDKIIINQELVDNIIILYDNGSIYTDLPSFSLNENCILECIHYIATTPKTVLIGINSKTKFKCMDYIKI